VIHLRLTNNRPILSPLQDLLALVCMLLRESDISRKVQVLSFFCKRWKDLLPQTLFFVQEEEKWYACCISNLTNLVWWLKICYSTELPDVSAAWENRSIVTTLIVNSRNHFDRLFWSGDIFMLTMWLCSAGKSCCNGIRKELSQKWTTLAERLHKVSQSGKVEELSKWRIQFYQLVEVFPLVISQQEFIYR